ALAAAWSRPYLCDVYCDHDIRAARLVPRPIPGLLTRDRASPSGPTCAAVIEADEPTGSAFMSVLAIFPPLLAVLGAPLLLGITNRTKAIFAGRTGPPLWQPYYDLAK